MLVGILSAGGLMASPVLAHAATGFVWPASGVISQNAAEHKSSFENQYAEDIANNAGTPVVASLGGTVVASEAQQTGTTCVIDGVTHPGGFGNVVVIRHSGGSTTYYTMYGHLTSRSVAVGDTVTQGQQIGLMGTTGCSSGNHVHFQIGTGLYAAGSYAGLVTAASSVWHDDPNVPADGTRVAQGTPTGGTYPGLAGGGGGSVADPTSTSYTGPTMGGHDQSVTLSGHLVDTKTSTVVAAKPIAFTLGTESCSGTTDASGDVSCSITLTQPPGDYTVRASFAGDSAFTASSDSKAFTITRTPTTTTVSAVPPGSSKFGQPVTFTATVAGIGSPGGSSPTGSVTFTIDGRTFAAIALTGGSASFATAALGAGAHTVTASYGGDADFLPSSGELAYAVTCDVNVAGVHQGALIVKTSTCLTAGARVNGAVIVDPGGALDVEASSIVGAIDARQGAGAIRVCGSTIGGAVVVKGAAGLVIVGDPAIGCAPNVIGGALDVQNNTTGVEAIDNSVGGAILTAGNSGPGPFPGDTTTISGNHHPTASLPPTGGPPSRPVSSGAQGPQSTPGTPGAQSATGAATPELNAPASGGALPAATQVAPIATLHMNAPAKRLTQAQKLAAAIHACDKLSKAKQRACIATATRRYRPAAKPKHKT